VRVLLLGVIAWRDYGLARKVLSALSGTKLLTPRPHIGVPWGA